MIQQLCSLVIYSKALKTYIHIKKLHRDIYSSFILNYWNLEATKMPFSRWKDKLVHPDDGILFSTKKQWAIEPWKDTENLKCISPSESSQSEKDYILYDSVYMTFLKRYNYEDNKKIDES